MRIGQGIDVHAFGPGAHVVLGGVNIEHDRGLVAHSDGDVVIHALCDAILGALALGDIGHHFPPGDPRWKDVSSRHFLLHCAGLIVEQGYTLANADVTVVCVDVPGCEPGAILATAPRGTVIFFSMATSFSAAALGAEGVAADVQMLIGNGYVPGHAEHALDLIRSEPGVRRIFEERL